MLKNKFWDWLELVTSLIIIMFLLIMTWYSMSFWNKFYAANVGLIATDMLMFYVAMLVAIVTVTAQWIEGRMKSVISSWNKIKGGANGKRRRK